MVPNKSFQSSVTIRGAKMAQLFRKSSLNNCWLKNHLKKFTSKLDFKVQKIYIKPPLKPFNRFNKPHFQTNYSGKHHIKYLKSKVAQNVANTSPPYPNLVTLNLKERPRWSVELGTMSPRVASTFTWKILDYPEITYQGQTL